MTRTLEPDRFTIGDRFIVNRFEDGAERAITIEVTGAREPHTDQFGRDQFKHMCRREDTGATGYMIYGFGAQAVTAAPLAKGSDMTAARTGTARRVTMTEARLHFEAGGSISVSEHGHELTFPVGPLATVHTSTTTTFAELRDMVNMWKNRHPNQRYYIVDWDEPLIPAPLAQLRELDEGAWRAVQRNADASVAREAVLAQALAAALLGGRETALEILVSGFYTMSSWPDLSLSPATSLAAPTKG